MSARIHLELFGGAGGTAHGIARALAPAGIKVWSVDNTEERHARNPYAWFTGDWREGLDRALQTGRVVSVGAAPPCTKNSAGTRAVDRSRYDNDPDLENVREVLIETGLPYFIENVESEVTKRKMRDPLRLCGSEFDLQADDPATGLRLWLKRHRFFEANFPLVGNGGCRHPKGMRCGGVYGGARRDEVEARTIRKGGYVPKDIQVLRQLLGAPEWMTTEEDLFLSVPPAYRGARRAAAAPRSNHSGGRSMTGQIPPYSSFSDLDKWGMYEPPPPAPSCPACGESTTYRSEHYVSALGHLSDPEDAIEPYYQCRPGLSAHEATRRARASSGVRDGV